MVRLAAESPVVDNINLKSSRHRLKASCIRVMSGDGRTHLLAPLQECAALAPSPILSCWTGEPQGGEDVTEGRQGRLVVAVLLVEHAICITVCLIHGSQQLMKISVGAAALWSAGNSLTRKDLSATCCGEGKMLNHVMD